MLEVKITPHVKYLVCVATSANEVFPHKQPLVTSKPESKSIKAKCQYEFFTEGIQISWCFFFWRPIVKEELETAIRIFDFKNTPCEEETI